MYQKELFANYELDDSGWKKALLALLGASLVLHTIFFLSAVYVPSVRDAFYIAGVLAGAPTQVYIDKEYELGVIEDAIVLDVSGPLEYPDGYFALANGDALPPTFTESTTQPQPEAVSVNNGFATDVSGFPLTGFAQPSPTPFPIPTPYPYPNSSIVSSGFPPVNASPNSSLPKLPRRKKGARVAPLPSLDETADAAPTPDKDETAKVTPSPKSAASPSPAPETQAAGFPINKKPLEDFGKTIKDRVLVKKDIDLNADFEVSLAGEFDKSGKVQKLARVSKFGDEEMIKVAEQMLLAVNESGWLKYLEDLYKDGNKNVLFSIKQDKNQVMFVIQAEEQTEGKANIRQNTLNNLIDMARTGVPGFFKPLSGDEATIINNTSVKADGKQVIIKLDMKREIAQEMIDRKLKEVKPPQPAAQTNGSNAQAVK